MRLLGRLAALIAILLAGPVSAEAWSPAPWLADLAQMRGAVETRYANRDWLDARGLNISAMFDRAAGQLRDAGSEVESRAVFDRLARRFADGHVEIDWPAGDIASTSPDREAVSASPCDDMGFDAAQSSPGIAPHLEGYSALSDSANLFPSGVLQVEGRPVGIIRIGVFQPQGSPALCHAAIAALTIPAAKPCDEKCQDMILTWAYARMAAVLAERLEQLRHVGATALIVDVSDNGGGTEWVEAAARMMTPVTLRSEPLGFVRGPQWAAEWGTLAARLREVAAKANTEDAKRLGGWIAQAETAKALAETPCSPGAACIGKAAFATGLVGSAPAGAFSGKSWGSLIFSPAQYPYRDGVWGGPLVVLVDDETWSAAEELAAELQDNHAAILVGQRTGGAGCGHTTGSEPVTLARSGGKLLLPDCIRYRADGSNEVRGVIPDVLVGLRASDRPELEARLLQPALAEAVSRAGLLRATP